MRYRLKSDHSVEFEGKREWSGLIFQQGFVYTGQTRQDIVTFPAWLFEKFWEPVPVEKMPFGAEISEGCNPQIENELDAFAAAPLGSLHNASEFDNLAKRAAAEIRRLRHDLRRVEIENDGLRRDLKAVVYTNDWLKAEVEALKKPRKLKLKIPLRPHGHNLSLEDQAYQVVEAEVLEDEA